MAKAADCKSAIAGSTPADASNVSSTICWRNVFSCAVCIWLEVADAAKAIEKSALSLRLPIKGLERLRWFFSPASLSLILIKLAKELIYLGAERTFKTGNDGRRPIHFAAMVGNLEIVKLLQSVVGFSTDRDSTGYTPLCLALAMGQTGVVEFLRETQQQVLKGQLDREIRMSEKRRTRKD